MTGLENVAVLGTGVLGSPIMMQARTDLGVDEGFYTYDSEGNVLEPVPDWNHT